MQSMKNILANFVDVIFVVGFALVYLVYLSAMMTSYCLSALVLGSGTKMSMVTNAIELVSVIGSNFF